MFALAAVLFLTGAAQRVLVRVALERALGTEATVESAALWGTLRVPLLELREPGAPAATPSAVTVAGLEADYALFAAGNRHLRRLTLDRLAVTLAPAASGATNHDFLRRFLTAPSSGIDPMLAIPIDTSIRRIDFRNTLGDFPVTIENLAFSARVASPRDLSCRISASPARVQWQFGGAPDNRDGDLNVTVQRQGTAWRFQGQAAIREFFDLDAEGTLDTAGARPEIAFEAKRLTLWEPALAAAGWRDTPAPVRFEQMDLSGSRVAGMLPAAGQPDNIEAGLQMQVTGLRVGEPSRLWYNGNVAVSGAGGLSENAAFEGSVTLNAGQAVQVSVRGGMLAGSAELSISDWPRPQIEALVPEAYRSYFDYARGLEHLAGDLTLAWNAEGASWEGTLAPAFAEGPHLVFRSQGAIATTGSGAAIGGKVTAATDTQAVELGFERQAGGAYAVTAAISDVDLAAWTGTVLPGVPPARLGGNLNGSAECSLADAAATIKLDLRGNGLQYASFALPKKSIFHISGMATVDTAAGTVQGGPTLLEVAPYATARLDEWSALLADPLATFQGSGAAALKRADVRAWRDATGLFALPDGLAAAVVDGEVAVTASEYDWRFKANLAATALEGASWSSSGVAPRLTGTLAASRDFSTWQSAELHLAVTDAFEISGQDCKLDMRKGAARAALKAEGDIGFLDALLGAPGLWGEVSFEAPVRFENRVFTLDTVLTTDTLGYGDLAVPYGETLRVEAACRYAPDTGTLDANNLSVALGEHTRLIAARAALDLSAMTGMADDIQITTDFAPFVAMEFLAEAAGKAELTGAVRLDGSAVRGHVQGTVRAEHMALPGATATLENLEATGDIGLEEDLSGSIGVSMTALSVGGVNLSGIQTTLRPERTELRSENIRATLFDGTVDATIAAGLLEPGLPVRLGLKLTNVDLERFTNEYKPPGMTLTGRASGTISIAFSHGALADLTVGLQAGDGFSMNRDMVEQLLLSQYVSGLPMGKSFERMLRQAIGKKPQRPFDSGDLELGFADGRIVGKALLESRDLSLDVDIKADPQAIVEALRARERAQ